MKDNGYERGLAEAHMQALMESKNGSNATWSVVERHDGRLYVQKEKTSGEIILYSIPTEETNNPSQ